MKKYLFLSIVAACVLMSAMLNPASETLAIGSKMPNGKQTLAVPVSSSTMVLNDAMKENGLLVIFSCNTCPFVIGWENRYNELNEIATRNKIGAVLVNSNEAKRSSDDSPEAMVAHAKEMGYTMPYVIDKNHELADAFGAKTTPHVFVFNKNKELVYKGSIDDNFKNKNEVENHYLRNTLNELGAGKTITTSETPAKGCSIKRVSKK